MDKPLLHKCTIFYIFLGPFENSTRLLYKLFPYLIAARGLYKTEAIELPIYLSRKYSFFKPHMFFQIIRLKTTA